jgi:uncharacterized protein (DUF1501 family)
MNIARNVSRRATLLGLSALGLGGRVKVAFASAPTEQRFVVVLLRGALDGMSAVVPYGDANLAGLRAPLLPPAVGQPGGMFDLGGFYGLHPAMPGVYAMYQAGQALPVHAVAGPYRTRSHFEAQDFLQLGTGDAAGDEAGAGITSGWLNRVLAELPAQSGPAQTGLAVGIGTPLLLQGPVRVGSYAPDHFATPSPDLYARIAALNAADPLTGPAIASGLKAQAFDQGVLSDGFSLAPGGLPKRAGGFAGLAQQVAALLAAPQGPRVAAFQLEGWDTHGNQVGGLQAPLSGLDAGLAALQAALGPVWGKTMVLVITEFGRTAAMNGTKGTDHGTATVAFLLGGNVAGGKIRATWPGLAAPKLFENRDLAATMDIRSVAKGALAAHFGLGEAALARVFPASAGAAPLGGLTRTA